jgi:hypothetical protein
LELEKTFESRSGNAETIWNPGTPELLVAKLD